MLLLIIIIIVVVLIDSTRRLTVFFFLFFYNFELIRGLLTIDQGLFVCLFLYVYIMRVSPVVDSDSSNTCCLPSRSLKTSTPDLKLFPDFLALPYYERASEREREKKMMMMIAKHLAANLTN